MLNHLEWSGGFPNGRTGERSCHCSRLQTGLPQASQLSVNCQGFPLKAARNAEVATSTRRGTASVMLGSAGQARLASRALPVAGACSRCASPAVRRTVLRLGAGTAETAVLSRKAAAVEKKP